MSRGAGRGHVEEISDLRDRSLWSQADAGGIEEDLPLQHREFPANVVKIPSAKLTRCWLIVQKASALAGFGVGGPFGCASQKMVLLVRMAHNLTGKIILFVPPAEAGLGSAAGAWGWA